MTMASELIGGQEQLEGLLLALERDRAGSRRWGEERDLQRHEQQQRREDALTDGRAGRRRRDAEPSVPRLDDALDHQREPAQQDQVDRQDDEGLDRASGRAAP